MRKAYGKYRKKYAKKIKIKSKYSKEHRRLERITGVLSNILAVVLVIIFIALVLKLTVYKKISLKANVSDIVAMNISYNDFEVLKNLAEKYNLDFPSLLTYYCAENNFFINKPVVNSSEYIEENFAKNLNRIRFKYKYKTIEPIEKMLYTILEEIIYFPIPEGFPVENGNDYTYGNTWGALREYGGNRTHQGTDIVDSLNSRGRIPVVSMTNGQIKHIGWNELGGYRIGILTENGTYYYYAHLSEFAKGLAAGDKIKAGYIIGFMGDSGYSKKEGTTGNFIVHLHVGISYNLPSEKEELWVNPYIFLRYVEKNRLILD